MSGLTFSQLRTANVARTNQVFFPLHAWSPTDWATAMAGECGEACNVVKKIRRLQDDANVIPHGTLDYVLLRTALAGELGDLVAYTDLLAARVGINLGSAVITKFNEVSEKKGSDIFLP